jgi:hypothetical protein
MFKFNTTKEDIDYQSVLRKNKLLLSPSEEEKEYLEELIKEKNYCTKVGQEVEMKPSSQFIDLFYMKNINNTNEKNKNTTYVKRIRFSEYKDDQNCKCKSWIEHWRNNTNSDKHVSRSCCVIGCQNCFQVGAHVQIIDQRVGNVWFVAPFCFSCSFNTSEMFIDSRVTLVPVSKQSGCK